MLTPREAQGLSVRDLDLADYRALLERGQELGEHGNWVWYEAEQKSAWSPNAREILGHGEEDVVWLFDLVHPDDQAIRGVDTFASAAEPKTVEYRIFRHSDRALRWIRETGVAELDEDGKPIRVFGSITDVTERHRLEERILQAGKLEAVAQLAAGVAHELNNLLTAIQGNTELALRSTAGSSGPQRALENVLHASGRAAQLVHELLVFARDDMSRARSVDFNHVVASTLARLPILREFGIALHVRLSRDRPVVTIDPGRLEQAVESLLTNACEATGPDGRVEVTTSVADDQVVLRVTDNGAGIDAAIRHRVFEPFFTTKTDRRGGAGLGLTAAYGITSRAGGTLTFDSRPGEGTTFELALPARAESHP